MGSAGGQHLRRGWHEACRRRLGDRARSALFEGAASFARSAARLARPAALLARLVRGARVVLISLGCAALGLPAGCSRERSRSGPAPSVRIEPARAARYADATEARNARETSRPRETRGARDESTSLENSAVSPGSAPDLEQEPGGQSFKREAAAPANLALDPGVNEEFDEDTVLDIDDALAAIDENAFATLIKKEQVWVNGELVKKEKAAHPDNCRRWRHYRNRGYAPKSALAKQIDAGALVRCGSLEFLARARPSRVTHVRDLLVGAGPKSFPAIVASATSPLALEARDRAVARGSSFAEFLPNARIIPSELPGRLSFSEPASDSSVILNAEVWGDINADGIEDLVLSVLNSADDGTSFEMRLLQVTRRSAAAPLSVLAVME